MIGRGRVVNVSPSAGPSSPPLAWLYTMSYPGGLFWLLPKANPCWSSNCTAGVWESRHARSTPLLWEEDRWLTCPVQPARRLVHVLRANRNSSPLSVRARGGLVRGTRSQLAAPWLWEVLYKHSWNAVNLRGVSRPKTAWPVGEGGGMPKWIPPRAGREQGQVERQPCRGPCRCTCTPAAWTVGL